MTPSDPNTEKQAEPARLHNQFKRECELLVSVVFIMESKMFICVRSLHQLRRCVVKLITLMQFKLTYIEQIIVMLFIKEEKEK